MNKRHKIFFIIAAFLSLFSWVITLYYWDKLPNVIPTHFGFNGMADNWADKSAFYVFMIPTLQSLILGLFVFLYKKPQYSDMPTTLWLMTLGKKKREQAFELIRTMLVGTLMWVCLLLSYITYGMNISAVNENFGLSPLILFTLITSMIIWLIFWSIKVYSATRMAIKLGHKK